MRYIALLLLASCGSDEIRVNPSLTPIDALYSEVDGAQREVTATRLDAAELLAAVREAHPEIATARRGAP